MCEDGCLCERGMYTDIERAHISVGRFGHWSLTGAASTCIDYIHVRTKCHATIPPPTQTIEDDKRLCCHGCPLPLLIRCMCVHCLSAAVTPAQATNAYIAWLNTR